MRKYIFFNKLNHSLVSRQLHNPEIQNALVSKQSTLIVNRYKYTASYA